MKKLSHPNLSRGQYLGVCYALFKGDSYRMVGNALGLTDSTVKAVSRQSGLDGDSFPRPDKTGTKLLSTEEVKELLVLRSAGLGVGCVAKALSVSGATVQYVEDMSFNVADSACTASHGRKLARAEVWAKTGNWAVRLSIWSLSLKEKNPRKVARQLGICEYRVKAVRLLQE